MAEPRPCKGCGKPIYDAKDADGKRHVIDTRPPVYELDTATGLCVRINGPGGAVKVGTTHFATCPKASEFGKSKRA